MVMARKAASRIATREQPKSKYGRILAGVAVAALVVVFGSFVTRAKPIHSAGPAKPEPQLGARVYETPSSKLENVSHLQASARASLQNIAPVGGASKLLDESALLSKLRDLGMSDPLLSLTLARQGAERFANSPNAPEFEWNAVKALFNMQRIDEAKQEAENLVWRYPNSDFTRDVDRHLLHPQPNPRAAP
jgi:hypothetical protein